MKTHFLLLRVQALYLLLTGIWPVVHIRSFLLVTGPKTDIWLVKTFGLVLVAISIAFFIAIARRETSFSTAVAAVSVSLSLMSADLYYSLRETISYIYLVDAGAQFFFICCWIVVMQRWKE